MYHIYSSNKEPWLTVSSQTPQCWGSPPLWSTSSAQTSSPDFKAQRKWRQPTPQATPGFVELPYEMPLSQSQLLRKSHQPRQITSTSSLHGNAVRHNCFSQRTRGSLVGREENRELVSLRNIGERCQMAQGTQGSQDTASITFLMPNQLGKAHQSISGP